MIVLDWIEAEHSFEDLQSLKSILRNVRIVGLGEATHGTREFFQCKHRMLEFLVKEMGFRIFAMEASYAACLPVNDYVLYGIGDRDRALNGLQFWTWKTKEVAEMLDWMREYNESVPEVDKVQFLGFDCQDQITPTLLFYKLINYPEWSMDSLLNNITAPLKEELSVNEAIWALQKCCEQLAALNDPRPLVQEVQMLARVWCQSLRLSQIDFENSFDESLLFRDVCMAENILALLDRYPGSRMVLWAHNAHIASGAVDDFSYMGVHLKKTLGSQYYSIGFDCLKGAFRAVDVSSNRSYGDLHITEFVFPEAREDSFAYLAAQTGKKNFMIDLRPCDYLDQPCRIWFVGASYAPDELVTPLVVLRNTYDGLIYIENTTASVPNNLHERTQTLLETYMERSGTVGAAISVIHDGNIEQCFAGKTSLNSDEPITKETLFEIGSISKVFTTLVLADCADEGVVQLENPIACYLPEITSPCRAITLKELATHHSGLPRIPSALSSMDWDNPYANYTVQDLYNELNRTVPSNKEFEYSNMGMGLLGAVLGYQQGMSFDELVQRSVCKPLCMANTSSHIERNRASGHCDGHEVKGWEFLALAPAGALRSTINDMTLFLAANLGPQSNHTTKLLTKCHEEQLRISPELGIGLGWMRSYDDKETIIWHNGRTGGFASFIGFNPATHKGVVILANSATDWPTELGMRLLKED